MGRSNRSCAAAAGSVALVVALLVSSGCASDDSQSTVPAGAAYPGAQRATAAGFPTKGSSGELPTTMIGRVSGIPTALTAPNDRELLVSEVTGKVRRFTIRKRSGYEVPSLERAPVLDLTGVTEFDGQNRGLLGLSFDRRRSRLLASFTSLDGSVVVDSFPYTAGGTVDPASGVRLISISHPEAGLSGGNITTDVAGNLVLAVGDMDQKYRVPPTAQDPSSDLGKILRLSSDPSAGRPTEVTHLAQGIRNPWGITVDPPTGDIWFGDVGDQRKEEQNRIDGSPGTAVPNFGWPYFEGDAVKVPDPPPGVTFTPAVLVRDHAYEVCAAVGGLVSRSPVLPSIRGQYVYGDLCSESVRALVYDHGVVRRNRRIATIDERMLNFGRGTRDEIYVLGARGGVYRLDPNGWTPSAVPSPPPTDPVIAADGAPTTTTAAGGPSTPTSELPADVCRIIDTFAALDPGRTLSPEEAKQRVTAALESLRRAEAAAPANLKSAVATFRETMQRGAELAATVGWNLDDPKVKQFRDDVNFGRPPFEAFPVAINALTNALSAGPTGQPTCPGKREP